MPPHRPSHAARCALHLLLTAGSLAPLSFLAAQVRASERGSVSQTVDGTTITIDYARPKVRGRDSIFGGVVHWGEVWTPGANWATTLTADKDITLDGHPIAAGSYSVWFELQPEGWTVILDPEPRLYHTSPPAEAEGQVRFAVQPEAWPHEEVLSWWFADVKPMSTLLRFAWATSSVPLTIGITPSRSFTVPSTVAEQLVGAWQTVFGTDTVGLTIAYREEHLLVEWDMPPDAPAPEYDMWLLALGEGMFISAMVKDGEPYDVEPDMVLEFTPADRVAATFEIRGPADTLMGTGWRAR